MEGIDRAIGDQPLREVKACHPDRTAVRARRFHADQPHVARFLNTRTREFGNEPAGRAVTTLRVPGRSLEAAGFSDRGSYPVAPVAGAPADDRPSADEDRGSPFLRVETVLDSLD